MADLEQAVLADVMPEVRRRMTVATDGRAAKALALERQSVMEELKTSGILRTATIVNFNPVWLRTTSAMPYSIPPCNWESQPDDMKLSVEYEGQTFQGSFLTVTEPYLFPKIRGMRVDDGTGDDVGDYLVKYVLPLGIVLDFWQTYNKSADQPRPMGGILVFEGNRNLLEKVKKDKDRKIKFPVAKPLPNGDRAYISVEKDFDAALAEVFKPQRAFAGFAIRQARGYYADEGQRKDITDHGHRVWGQLALDHGWGIEVKEPWMFESITTEVLRCDSCGLPRKEKAHFCQGCNAPYDPYTSFMAGRAVPEQYLYSLKGKELADVQAEMKRRRALFADGAVKV